MTVGLALTGPGCVLFSLEPPCGEDAHCETGWVCDEEGRICVEPGSPVDAGSDDAGSDDAGA